MSSNWSKIVGRKADPKEFFANRFFKEPEDRDFANEFFQPAINSNSQSQPSGLTSDSGLAPPEFCYLLSARCLAQASATLLSALSSPGMIAQLCFSI